MAAASSSSLGMLLNEFASRITLNTGSAPGMMSAQKLSISPVWWMTMYQGIKPPENRTVIRKNQAKKSRARNSSRDLDSG